MEVVFEDGSVQLVSNRLLLRNCDEILLSPTGPPKWNRSEAVPRLGAQVAIFDVDPNTAGLACSRFLGISSSKLLSSKDCKTLITSLIPKSVLESGFDVDNILASIHVESGIVVDTKTLLKRIFTYKEKYTSVCDRLLLGHTSSVVSISFMKSSNLLVTIDSEGSCCVWDPFAKLSIVGASPCCTAATGTHPYSLVSKVELHSQARVSLRVQGSVVCPIQKTKQMNMPITKTAFLKALAIEKKYKPSDVLLRGMFYVLPDMSIVSLRTNAFNLTLVTLENSEEALKLFAYANDSDNVCSKIYRAKGNIIRSIYVISCSHSSMASLEKDLQQFGVFQKGYADTPSDLISLVCFERNPRCAYRKNSGTTSNVSGNSGILLSAANGDVRIGLDYSNDIVQVSASSLHTLFDRLSPSGGVSGKLRIGDRVDARYHGGAKVFSGKISYDNKDGTFDVEYDDGEKEHRIRADFITSKMPPRIDNASDSTSLGSHVFFRDSNFKDLNDYNDHDACEVLYVIAEKRDTTCFFPVYIGRTCLPLSAADANFPLSSDDFYKAKESYLQFYRVSLGMARMHSCCLDRFRVYKQGSINVQRSGVITALSSETVVDFSQHLAPLLSYISSCDSSERVRFLVLFIKLGLLGTSLAHPLMVYLDGILIGAGFELIDQIRRQGVCGGKSLSDVIEKWYTYLMITYIYFEKLKGCLFL